MNRAAWLGALAGLLAAGCATGSKGPPPASTSAGSARTVLPAQVLGNYLIVEAKWDKTGPYRFLIDTGSAVTLVSPDFAKRYAIQGLEAQPQVQVYSSLRETKTLPAVTLTGFSLGEVRFISPPALVYDCSELSAHLGLKIDGILGFPLFRDVILTLDYPRSRVVLARADSASPPGSVVGFDPTEKTPFVDARLGSRRFRALVDSGYARALILNPDGLAPKFAFGPIAGPTAGTLAGDHTEQVGRLADTLFLGDFAVPRPVAEVTDGVSDVGGAILKNFTVTFDPGRARITFAREATDPIAVPGLRDTGLSFDKRPAYWKVVGVVPGSPAAAAGVEPGDLVSRINGETLDHWDFRRYERLLANAEEIAYTFLDGTRETEKRMKVADIVP